MSLILTFRLIKFNKKNDNNQIIEVKDDVCYLLDDHINVRMPAES